MNFASDLRDGDVIYACKSQRDLEGFEIEEAKTLEHVTLLMLRRERYAAYIAPELHSRWVERRTAFLYNSAEVTIQGRKPLACVKEDGTFCVVEDYGNTYSYLQSVPRPALFSADPPVLDPRTYEAKKVTLQKYVLAYDQPFGGRTHIHFYAPSLEIGRTHDLMKERLHWWAQASGFEL